MYEVIDETKRADLRIYPKRQREPMGAMIHTTDGVNSLEYLLFGSIRDQRYASADYLVSRKGAIHRLAPIGRGAYHAGVCLWGDHIDRANATSMALVGIEVENADSKGQLPTVDQHRAVAGLVRELAHAYKWAPLAVYGHYGLAYPMGRRSDPRGWDWGYMFWLMAHAPAITQLAGATHLIGK